MANGLPNRNEIIEILQNSKYPVKRFRVLGNVNIFAWVIMHFFVTVLEDTKVARVIKVLNPLLLILGQLKIPPYYRAIFIIEK